MPLGFIPTPDGPNIPVNIPAGRGLGVVRFSTTAGKAIYLTEPGTAVEHLVYGDTGTRNMLTLAGASWASGIAQLNRVGRTVTLNLQDIKFAPGITGTFDLTAFLPVGFRPPGNYSGLLLGNGSITPKRVLIAGSGLLRFFLLVDGEIVNGTATWATTEAWPTTLPGTAIGVIPTL